jgi:hypothetical protein
MAADVFKRTRMSREYQQLRVCEQYLAEADVLVRSEATGYNALGRSSDKQRNADSRLPLITEP